MRWIIQLSIFSLLFVGYFSHYTCATVQSEIDSLKSLLETAKYDTNRVHLLNKLCWKYKYKDPTIALEYVNEALKLAKKLVFNSGIAQGSNYLGIINLTQGNYDKAIELHLKSLQLYETSDNKYGIASSLVNLGVVYYYLDYLDKANEYYIRALNIWRKLDIKKQIAGIYNNIAIVFREQKKYVESLDYYSRSLSIREDIGDKKGISDCLNNLGTLHARLNDHNKAISYYQRSLKINDEIDYKMGVTASLFNISELHYKQDNLKKTKEYLKKSLEIANEVEAADMKEGIYESYANVYALEKNFKQAFKYYKMYSDIKDELFNEEKSKEIGKLEAKYEMEKKISEEKLRAKEQEILATEQKKRRDNLQYSGILIFIVLLFTGVFMLGKFSIPIRLAEGMIFFSFLLFFEFTLVLLDPYIEQYSSGAPAIKLGFNAILAALIFPMHSFFEAKFKNQISE